jgi:hypothetical protein
MGFEGQECRVSIGRLSMLLLKIARIKWQKWNQSAPKNHISLTKRNGRCFDVKDQIVELIVIL